MPQVARCWASCDADTVLLLVTRAQLPSLVSADLYPALVAAILQLDPAVAQLAADQLQEAGHTAQAAAIQVTTEEVMKTSLNIKCLFTDVIGWVPPGTENTGNSGAENVFQEGVKYEISKMQHYATVLFKYCLILVMRS